MVVSKFVFAIAGLAALGLAAVPGSAKAWWVRPGVVVVAPPPVYVAPPVYYAPPVVYAPGYPVGPRVWIAPHWQDGYWVRGRWR